MNRKVIEQLKTKGPTSLEKINLNVENVYKNCKLNTIADYFMFDKWHENWWDKNIYIHDNQQGDRCVIEFGDEYIIGVFFVHEMYNDIRIQNFFAHVPKDIYEKAQKGVLQYMLIDDNAPKITTMFFVKNNETYSIHKKEIFIKNGGWLISEINYKKMLEKISDDYDCGKEDLMLIEEIYNKIAETKKQKIRLEDKIIKSMHGKITKERIENFGDIDIIISDKYIIPECNNHVDSTIEKYNSNRKKWILLFISITLFLIIYSIIVIIITNK